MRHHVLRRISWMLAFAAIVAAGAGLVVALPTLSGPQQGVGRPSWTLLLALAGLALLAWGRSRFTHVEGRWRRVRPRRRWTVGPRSYARAQSLGFRFSRTRQALVLRPWQGRYGPVLRLRDPEDELPRQRLGVPRERRTRGQDRVAAMGRAAEPAPGPRSPRRRALIRSRER